MKNFAKKLAAVLVILGTMFACSPEIPMQPYDKVRVPKLKMRWTHPIEGLEHDHYTLEIQFENEDPVPIAFTIKENKRYGYTRFTKPGTTFRLRVYAVAEDGISSIPSEWSDWVVV